MQVEERQQIEMKRFRAEVKAEAPEPGAATGTFDARVAAFGNVDTQGDRIEEGAFDGTVAEWKSSGDPVPVIWSHQWDDPMAHIGYVQPDDLKSTPEGLEVHGTIDLSTDLAKQVHRLMVDRRVKEFSFAYLPTEAEPDGDVRVLKGLDLIELGPTLKGANQETELFGAKAAIGPHDAGTDDGTWDGPANEARLPNSAAALRAAHAWVDPDGDPDAKSTYKFIHHDVGEDGRVGAANLTAASTGIGVLNGGRGGASIPDDDRGGVHGHLAKHLRDGDREPPELRAFEPDEAEGTGDGTEHAEEQSGAPGQASVHDAEAKMGRVLSKANETKLRSAGDLIGEVLASIRDDARGDEAGDGGKAAEPADSEGGNIHRAQAQLRALELEEPA